MSWVGGSTRMMVGTDRGSVHAVDISSFQATEESFLGEKYVGQAQFGSDSSTFTHMHTRTMLLDYLQHVNVVLTVNQSGVGSVGGLVVVVMFGCHGNTWLPW